MGSGIALLPSLRAGLVDGKVQPESLPLVFSLVSFTDVVTFLSPLDKLLEGGVRRCGFYLFVSFHIGNAITIF